jgi:hypothetical protein
MTIPGTRNALVNPRFAANPPLGLKVDAKSIGIVVIIFSLYSIGTQSISVAIFVGISFSVRWAGIFSSHGFFFQTFGPMFGLLGALLSLWGGWRMWRGYSTGKNWIVAGLGLGIVSDVAFSLTFPAAWQIDLQSAFGVVLLLGLCYVVVISRLADTSIPEMTPGSTEEVRPLPGR